MKKEIIDCYRGFLINSEIEVKVQSFLNVVSNNKKNKVLDKTNLIIASDTRDRAINFAHDTFQALSKMKLCTSYKIFSANEMHETQDDLLIIDGFNANIKWNDIKNKLNDINQIVIFCTDKNSQNIYLKNISEYYALFSSQIILDQFNVEEIKSGAYFYFKKLESTKEINIDESFFPALYEYIDTVYPRANLKGEEFVYDLKERFLRESYATDHPRKFTADTIPYYFKKENSDSVKKVIREDFCFSSCINKILEDIDNENKAKSLKLSSYKPTFNINLFSEVESITEMFARQYGALLNSAELNVISAKDVITMNPYEFMLERNNIANKHGIILLRDFNRLIETENADEVIQYVINAIDNGNDDLVWILSGDTKFFQYFNDDNRAKLEFLFRKSYSLDEHDENTSTKYIETIYRRNGLEISNENLNVLKKQVITSKNLQEANKIVESYLAEHIGESLPIISSQKETNTVSPFQYVLDKENSIRELVKNIPNSKNEENVLLLAMSTINLRTIGVSEYIYQDQREKISGFYVSQLEPVPKAIAEKLASSNEKLDKIVVLNTKKTLEQTTIPSEYRDDDEYSAFTYFKKRCNCVIPESDVINVNLQTDDENSQVEKAIYTFTKTLTDITFEGKKVNLYVDIHGGLRDISTIVDALLMLIKEIPNIELKDIFTVTFAGKESKIDSVINDFKIFDFVSGMNEFLSFGRSNGLIEFNRSRENLNDTELTNNINKISNSIILGRSENFEEQLSELSRVVNNPHNIRDGYYDTVRSIIRENYKVKIGDNSYDLMSGDKYFPAVVQWCLNKKLIQQALVLIENRTASVLESNNIIINNDYNKLYNSNRNNSISDLLNNWVINSLVIDANIDIVYQNGKMEAPKRIEKGKKVKKEIKENIIPYKGVKQYFNGIKPTLNLGKLIQKINKELNKECDLRKFCQSIEECPENEDCYLRYFNNNLNKPYLTHPISIPVPDVLCDDKQFLESFYALLFMFKYLKKYRNTVAHPSQLNKNTRDYTDLPIEEVEQWIKSYIELLDRLIKESQEILNKNNNSNKEKIDNLESLKKLMNNRYGH